MKFGKIVDILWFELKQLHQVTECKMEERS